MRVINALFFLVVLAVQLYAFASLANAGGYSIQQSTTAQPLIFLMTDSTDHISAKTGLSPTVTISKNGGSFAAPSGAVTEIANGWYKVAGNATDSGTLGPLILHATGTGADPTDVVFNVVAFNPQDAVRMGLTALPNANAASSGGLLTSGTSANQLSTSSGAVTVGTNNDKTGYTASTVSDKTGYSLSTSQTFNTTGSVGSVTGAVGSVTAGVTVTTNNDKTGYTASTVSDKAGYSLSASQAFNTTGSVGSVVGSVGGVSGVTFPAQVASPTNITSGTITTVTNLTNAPANGDLTATMKASVGTAVNAATSVTAIKAKTDQLQFTVPNQVDSNAKSMNSSSIIGTGASGDHWRH